MSRDYEQSLSVANQAILNLVKQYPQEELNRLISDDTAIDNLIQDLPQFAALKTEKDMLLQKNKSIADWNLSQEPKLREAKTRLLETYDRAAKLRTECLEKKSELEGSSEERSLDTTLSLLEAAAAEAEDESEKLAESMLDGEVEFDAFIPQFIDIRMRAHERKIKADQMKDILRNQNYSGINASSNNIPPYPMGNRRMAPPPPPSFNYTL